MEQSSSAQAVDVRLGRSGGSMVRPVRNELRDSGRQKPHTWLRPQGSPEQLPSGGRLARARRGWRSARLCAQRQQFARR
eukprot:10741751-Alexandrium_andersonii.AAC.1